MSTCVAEIKVSGSEMNGEGYAAHENLLSFEILLNVTLDKLEILLNVTLDIRHYIIVSWGV